MARGDRTSVASLLVRCLESEGVEYVFGIPGEENIRFVDALNGSAIRFILTRHEQGASFMADIYGRLTGRAGVCCATLGPGAINLLLGTADADTCSAPLVAIGAQVGLERIYKESHQIVDLVAMFKPVTKWADTILAPSAVPEMVRKAFEIAETERPGATFLAVPEDVEAMAAPPHARPIAKQPRRFTAPTEDSIACAAALLRAARHPIILAGHGVVRAGASAALSALALKANLPVATTFHAKGVISDRHANALGAIGFMLHDYENFAFDRADVILSIGYELQEFSPARINPAADKTIIHLHGFAPDVDACYRPAISVDGDIATSIERLGRALADRKPFSPADARIRALHAAEIDSGRSDSSFPLKPQRIVHSIRSALGDEDIVLVDTGALKMWMARLYPTYAPNTCIISNGLSTMAFALPGAIAAKLARPERNVLATMGDGSFLMNAQEIETAVRERIPLVALVWVDRAYGLIKWKMDLALHRHSHVDFGDIDYVKFADSMGARGEVIQSAEALVPALDRAFRDGGVSVIACPVDYAENAKLSERLGALTVGR